VAAIGFPLNLASPFAEPGKDCFVRTADGCLLRARADGGLKYKRFPKLALKPEEMVALWGCQVAPDMPDDDAWPMESGAVLVERDKPAKALGKWKLGGYWLEFPDNPFAVGVHSYAESPPIWLRKPVAVPEGSGLVRLRSGEELVLSAAAFALKGWSSVEVVLTRGGEETKIPAAEVASLVFPHYSKRETKKD
jgi:hypothetical protein